MSNLIIINNSKPTLPTQTYCYSGRWPCEDSLHNCPGVCGYVRYKDEQGNIVEEFGFCTADTNIQIIASEIIEVRGLNIESCSGTFRSLSAGNMTCVNGQVHFTGNDITLYSLSSESNIIDGDRLYTDSAMTIPYSPTTNGFIKDNNNYIYSVGINGYINYEGYQGGTCQI